MSTRRGSRAWPGREPTESYAVEELQTWSDAMRRQVRDLRSRLDLASRRCERAEAQLQVARAAEQRIDDHAARVVRSVSPDGSGLQSEAASLAATLVEEARSGARAAVQDVR